MRRVLPVAILTAVAGALAWRLRFLCDDAFISFHYARNLVEGNGLTWFGDPVEGYTNFLWVMTIAAGIKAGFDPPAFSQTLGILALIVLVPSFGIVARRHFDDPIAAFLATLTPLVSYTFLSFATSGLETMAQAAAIMLFAALVIRPREGRATVRLAFASVTAAVALLLRLDSIVLLAPLALFAVRRPGTTMLPDRGRAITLLAPASALLIPWLLWKASYYGSLLPNTFTAKVSPDPATLFAGLTYLGRFVHWYGYSWLLFALFALGLARGWSRAGLHTRAPWITTVLAWLAYVAFVGGDFMEFRFLVPVIPAIGLLTIDFAWSAGSGFGRRARITVAGLSVIVLLAFGVHHARTFTRGTGDLKLDSIPALASFYGRYEHGDWARFGTPLGEAFPGDTKIALHAVGAIPWYSRLETVDMWGLNDREIARTGTIAPPAERRPGHARHASLDELRRRGVHFVIGHPTTVPRGALSNRDAIPALQRWIRYTAIRYNDAPIGVANLVALPVDDAESLLLWYLTPSAAIDRAVEDAGFETIRFRVPDTGGR